MLRPGDPAPELNIPNQNKKIVNLSDFKDKTIILYFYPKDLTPGCTKEACSFKDAYIQLSKRGITVLGVNKDDTNSHQKFIEKHNLPFQLLSDPKAQVIKAYGAWGTKKFMGRTYEGILRSSFIIKNKKIIRVYDEVNCPTHAEDILKDLS